MIFSPSPRPRACSRSRGCFVAVSVVNRGPYFPSALSRLNVGRGIQELVQVEVQRWASKGINIKYETRSNRKGYKAGALKQGMKHPYVGTCEHVAIFDADFQPEADFLMRTVPFLVKNQRLGLVQARWKFGKPHFPKFRGSGNSSMMGHGKVPVFMVTVNGSAADALQSLSGFGP